MLSNINATINANAQSLITDGGVQKVLCSFNGFTDGVNMPSITKTIKDQELYLENKAIARQDEDAFEEYMMSLATN